VKIAHRISLAVTTQMQKELLSLADDAERRNSGHSFGCTAGEPTELMKLRCPRCFKWFAWEL
jgi:hypothetical protein